MISDFSFESPIVLKRSVAQRPPIEIENPLGLELPLFVPGQLLNLIGVDLNLRAFLAHFAPLQLKWNHEVDKARGGVRVTGLLETSPDTGAIWALTVLEGAGTGKHRHNEGGPYGEFVVTLAGELDDILDDGTAVKLLTGDVMFHAVNTIHEARAEGYWAGLYHQPRGCTPIP
jgi:quercetin dioxygenase-like cupin family protein